MEAFRSIADRNSIPMVQDCAHAIECELNDRNVATFGDLACYSFYATKNLTTGEGGMVVTDNQEWADRGQYVLRSYCPGLQVQLA
jgi:perosamine synthetase